MRFALAVVVCTFAAGGVARAQTPGAPQESSGYVEVFGQSSFGNVTSQSYGVEAGVSISRSVQVYGEFGRVRDTAPGSLGAAAQLIAGYLSQTQSNIAYTARQPMTFGDAGVKYLIPSTASHVEPYILGGFGLAHIKKDVTFTAGGTDITNNLPQLGVVLGEDLTGSETKPMLSFGAGVAWPAWRALVIDFQYRYGLVFASGDNLNVNRAGVGIGVRF